MPRKNNVVVCVSIELGATRRNRKDSMKKMRQRSTRTKRSARHSGRRSAPAISKAERTFRAYLKRRSMSYGQLADLMDADPKPRLAGAELITSYA